MLLHGIRRRTIFDFIKNPDTSIQLKIILQSSLTERTKNLIFKLVNCHQLSLDIIPVYIPKPKHSCDTRFFQKLISAQAKPWYARCNNQQVNIVKTRTLTSSTPVPAWNALLYHKKPQENLRMFNRV